SGVILEGVENPISVMRVDIHIGDSLEPGSSAQHLDGDSAIVENTKTRCVIASRMMQTRDRDKCATTLTAHDRGRCIQSCANDYGRSLINSTECRRIAGVEETLPGQRAFLDEVHIL